jgi:hypothetical protein
MTDAPKVSKNELRSNEPPSHAKGVAHEGNLKGPQSKETFQKAASPSAPQSAQGKAAEPKPAPQQHHQPKGPGGQSVTKAHSEKKMNDFHGQAKQDAHTKALKERANSVTDRQDTKGRGKMKGDDNLQK